MNVLTVLNWLKPGGIEVMLLHSLPGLHRNGINTDICCMGPGTLDDLFRSHGCKIHYIPKTPNCYATARYCRNILAHNKYDVVHSCLGYISGGIASAADEMGIPSAVSFHSAMPLSLYHWRMIPVFRELRTVWLRWHRHLMQHHVRMFVGHSQANIEAYEPSWHRDPARYRVILNGIQFPNRIPNRLQTRSQLGLDDELTLLHVGTFREEKNHNGLLQIFRNILLHEPKAILMLVGDGKLRETITQQARKLKMSKNIRFAGTQSDPWPYYAAADVFIFPSVVEGFGNVLVESQAAHLPIVASDIPAHHESVAPSQQRFLFPLPQYEKAAELVLEQAEMAKQKRNHWVAESGDYVRRKFSIERYASDLKNLYDDLMHPAEFRAASDLGPSFRNRAA